MKVWLKRQAVTVGVLLLSFGSQAGILEDFDSLGGNDVLVERAQQLQPDKSVEIVQGRIVDRRIRHEISAGYGNFLGGDAFNKTQTLDLNYNFHLNPYFAVGLGYFGAYNKLSREARYTIDTEELVPDVDAPQSGYELVVHGYPMYGKFNLANLGIVHFDFYGLASFGKIKLVSGDTNQYSVGAGIGLWLSQHLTGRMELKQRFFEAQRFDSTVDMNMTVLSFSIGYLI